MKKTIFASQSLGSFRALTRDQLKKVLGGDQCCTCIYNEGTVDNTCDDGDTITGCCGPAASGANCFACDE